MNALTNADIIPTPKDPPNAGSVGFAAPVGARISTNAAMPLRRDQKAAVIVRLLQEGQLDLPLGEMETNTLAQLVRATAGLSFVSEADTLQIISDFLSEIESLALYFRPGIHRAMDAFHDQLDENVETLLLSDTPKNAVDPWPALSVADAPAMAKIMATETPQVCGVVLAKLPTGKAAEVLVELDPELARAATLAATQSSGIPMNTVVDIGLTISGSLGAQSNSGALGGDPVERVGAILNFTPGPTREKLLHSIEAVDPILADKMRKIMFTFADIPDRIDARDIPKVVRAVDNEVLLTALVGGQQSNPDTVEFILANISKRLVEQLKEEMDELGEVKVKDAEAAMSAVIQEIKDMEETSAIILIATEE